MHINQITKILKNTNPLIKTQELEKAWHFLQEKSKKLSLINKKKLIDESIILAEQAALNNASPLFITALLLQKINNDFPEYQLETKKQFGRDIDLIIKAYNLSQKNYSPENFQYHLTSAFFAAETKLDAAVICALLLYNLPLQNNISLENLKKEFNHEIILLLKNFYKISNIKCPCDSKYIDNLRQMFLAMTEDLRAILMKVCTTITSLKNFNNQESEEKKLVALEAMEVLAPLSDLLGIWHFRWQLEDYAFKYLNNLAYKDISKRFNIDEKKNREKYIQKTKNILEKKAREQKITFRVEGRFKHFYSIYQKMQEKAKSFDEIYDVFALRVIVQNEEDCYKMLGLIHKIWKPKPYRVKDYIAAPKNNQYQSLHTTVFGLNGRLTEFQIRTREMNENAKYGIAAHWFYKNEKLTTPFWVKELIRQHSKHTDDQEFFKKIKTNFLGSKIFVYTPKGDVLSLPKGATVIDFAYHVHSQIGNKCIGVLVNNREQPLKTILKTGDQVKILVDRQNGRPKPEWLNFITTSLARKHITDFLKKHPQ